MQLEIGLTGSALGVLVAVLLGVRHGIDWDHIAAITDVTAGAQSYRRGLLLGAMYAVGHSAIVIVLGAASVILGIALPEWLDDAMQPLVGATLVLLGVWILFSLIRAPERFQMRSRWMLIYDGIRAAVSWVRRDKHPHERRDSRALYGWRTAISIGLIHGIGAETPTQVLLFVSAAGAAGAAVGLSLVAGFVVGLFVSNTAVSFAAAYGYVSATRSRTLYLGAGAVSGVFSLVVGALFLLGRAELLPALFGG
jgi:high-affinity nickel permease